MDPVKPPAFTRWLKGLRARPGSSEELPEHIQKGSEGEREAYDFLRRKGFRVLARNYRRAGVKGEIDLVAWELDTLVFVEVKTRRWGAIRAAEDAVDRAKRRAMARVARTFRRQARLTRAPYRFDVVSVYKAEDGRTTVEHFPAAFREQDS